MATQIDRGTSHIPARCADDESTLSNRDRRYLRAVGHRGAAEFISIASVRAFFRIYRACVYPAIDYYGRTR